MQRFEKFASSLGLEHAIILAPMAGGISTPALVAAVSNAGGLGSMGAGYLTPEQITESIAQIRALTTRPFAVNLFAGGPDGTGARDVARMLELMTPHHTRLGLPAPATPDASLPSFKKQVEVVLEAKVPVFSFTFGIPAPEIVAKMKACGIKLMGTATTVAEARALHAAGVDAIAAQGSEAGAHRGTFLASCEDSLIGTLALVPQIVDAVPLPVIASGGIMDGRGIVAAAALGASGVQMGTAFLACPESGASEAYKAAVLAARDDATLLTRAFSGRMARGIANSFAVDM
jgi:nitronate monooxygenase